MSHRPEVAIILPFHGAAPFLDEALQSVADQASQPTEVILVDDDADDSARAMAASFCAKSESHYVVPSTGVGIADALMTGIAVSSAPLIARMDADDRMLPDRIARQSAYLAANPDVAVVGSQVRYIDADGNDTGRSCYATDTTTIDRVLRRACPISHPTALIRRDALERVGGYRTVFRRGRTALAEDYDLWLRIDATQGRIRIIDEVLLEYREHAGQVSASTRNDTALATLGVALIAARERHDLPPAFPIPLEIGELETMTRDHREVARLLTGLPRREKRELQFDLDGLVHRADSNRHMPGPFPLRAIISAPDLVARDSLRHTRAMLERRRSRVRGRHSG